MSRRENEKTFAEFFAGIGLIRYGLEPGGWRCVYANDNDPKKAAMYADQFGDEGHYHLGDVWDTDAVLERLECPPILATASFPCTDMSLAGRREGFEGRESSAFFGFARVLESLPQPPPLVLLENVVGFATSHGGRDLAAALTRLGELGYWLDVFQLDARHFMPQSRPRLFVLGAQPEAAARWPRSAADAWFGQDVWEAGPVAETLRPLRLRETVRRAEVATGWIRTVDSLPEIEGPPLIELLDLDERQEWWDREQVDRHLEMMTPEHRARVDGAIESGGPAVATVFRRVRQGAQRAEPRWDGLAGCLRTPRGGSARQIVLATIEGRVRMRWMTPREYARLQGAGDFEIRRGSSQSLFGFGDAVCAPVLGWIDRQALTPSWDR